MPSDVGVRTDFTPGWPATYRAALLLIEIDSISLIGPKVTRHAIDQGKDSAHCRWKTP